jgi:hypothetical protein
MGLIIPPEDILHGPPERSVEVMPEKANGSSLQLNPSDYPVLVPMLSIQTSVESLQLDVLLKSQETRPD